MKKDIDKNMEQLKKKMDSRQFRQSMQKMKDVNMEQLKEQINKAKIEAGKNREELKKQLQKMKEELEAKNAAMMQYGFGCETAGFIWI
jgi:hypothetical protein